MNSDLRRSRRYNDFIPVQVLAKNGVNGNRETAVYSGRIINISRHGACLLMPLGAMQSYEVYSKTHQDDSTYLEIRGNLRDENEKFAIPARPVWSDPFIIGELHAYKMGVEFMTNPEGEQMNSLMETVTAQ